VKWQFWDSAHWDPACAIFAFENYVKQLFQRGEPDAGEIARGEEMFARLAPVLDGELQKHRYVAGEALTLADFSLGAMNYIAEHAKFPLESYRGIQRWAADLKIAVLVAKDGNRSSGDSAGAMTRGLFNASFGIEDTRC
jgi:glutathione S-transferase